jgi:hypothetical protein
MIRLKESILVKKSLDSVFKYTSDFSHIQDWDPGVVSSVTVDHKKIGVGSQYDLVLKFGPFRPKMKYEIIEYDPFSRVVLKGVGESFTAMDTIVFRKTAGGTQIDYQADIRFHRRGNVIDKILSPVIKKTGQKAMAGLEQKLDRTRGLPPNKTMWFKSGTGLPDYLADHLIIPGMLLFSRFGYELGRRFWSEPKGVLYGKRIVLTGGTSGIGKAAAFKLAEKKSLFNHYRKEPCKG